MASVTFDSNAWRPVVTPSRFPNDPNIGAYTALRTAIKNRALEGFLSESTFTLEQVRRIGRKDFFTSYRPNVRIDEHDDADGMSLRLTIAPQLDAHGGNPPVVAQHLDDALSIGFRILRVPRIAGIVNPDMDDSYFVAEPSDQATRRNERFGECSIAIEARGAGMAQVKALGRKYAPANRPWFDGVKYIPDAEEVMFVKAVSEWADGDSVAAHYAYNNDVFCTNDVAVGGGPASVLSDSNRAWLTSQFGIIFASPDEAVALCDVD